MIYVIFLIIEVLICLYFVRQLLNKFKIKYGKVKISDMGNEKVIETNKNPKFQYYFGVPGCGKTTTLSYIAKTIDEFNDKLVKKGKKKLNIYSNIKLKDIDYKLVDKTCIGHKYLADGWLLIDESSIMYNNREYKTFGQKAIEYYKEHRHYNISVIVFSQSFDDTDITLRRLCDQYYHVYKSLFYIINHRIIIRGISKFLDIKKDDKQIIDGYKYKFFNTYRLNGKKYFKYFNSNDRDLNLERDPAYYEFT